jgi:hypothetical protein
MHIHKVEDRTDFVEMVRRLYDEMPGAEHAPRDERGKLWGEVEHTPHYQFCEQIAREIFRASGQ